MTWIKTNFLWMMYRCGWATKDPNQERVLAIWLKRESFLRYLSLAVPSKYTRCFGSEDVYKDASKNVSVRLQWDPDHTPSGGKTRRRAIQLGLKGMASFVDGSDILYIRDITEFVRDQRETLERGKRGDGQEEEREGERRKWRENSGE